MKIAGQTPLRRHAAYIKMNLIIYNKPLLAPMAAAAEPMFSQCSGRTRRNFRKLTYFPRCPQPAVRAHLFSVP